MDCFVMSFGFDPPSYRWVGAQTRVCVYVRHEPTVTTRQSKLRIREASLAARLDDADAQAPNAHPKRPKACLLAREMHECFLSCARRSLVGRSMSQT